MNLMPLMDRRGDVTAWADRNSGWVSDRIGKVFALVSFDSVFNQTGAQVGWWYGDHIRDRYGRVVLVRPVLLGVKAWQVEEPAKNIRPMVGPSTSCPVAKWVEAASKLAAVLGAEHVLGGLCEHSVGWWLRADPQYQRRTFNKFGRVG